MVGETPLRRQDIEDPPVQRGFLGRAKGVVGIDDPKVKVTERKQWRDKVARPLSQGVAARDAGDVAKSLKLLKEADNEARLRRAAVELVGGHGARLRLLIRQGETSEGTGLADLAAMGSNRHAKPRLQLEGLRICARTSSGAWKRAGRSQPARRSGRLTGCAGWRRGHGPGSMSAAGRHLYRKADKIATTYNNPRNTYDPGAWTPEGWARANTPG